MRSQGKGSISGGRKIIGATNPANAEPGSIRGDYCLEVRALILAAVSFDVLTCHMLTGCVCMRADWPKHHPRL